MPMIQAAVKSIVPESVNCRPSLHPKPDLYHRDKLAQNVNADEAAVLGAVLYGAGLSSQFKAKDIRVRDVTPRAVQAVYLADDKASEGASGR